ncbi:hypothetical protein [Pseudoduganella armeniaca]|uniref:Uncharacterized protein n=1 Tax=Pseudoduganella armeniaca TaxID=2072590 RepID=A0A2R4CB43_9BURK|nr:hypothetical protein [Pseudoduganella armeniaca]AVR96782.1 hypothetical protein C9I28_14700 [Pseudoduganella armeniaca]
MEKKKTLAPRAVAAIMGEHRQVAAQVDAGSQAFFMHISSILSFGVLPRNELVKRGLTFQPSEDVDDTPKTSFGSVRGTDSTTTDQEKATKVESQAALAKETLHGVATERNVEGNILSVLHAMARAENQEAQFLEHQFALGAALDRVPQQFHLGQAVRKLEELMGLDNPLLRTLRRRLNDSAVVLTDRPLREIKKDFPEAPPLNRDGFAEVRGQHWLLRQIYNTSSSPCNTRPHWTCCVPGFPT